MSNLGVTYGKLGRYADALALQESVLEIIRREQPGNHHSIGEGHVWSDVLHVLC